MNKKKKTTKRNLVSSIISLMLCVSMFIGTTFAWFTDSVSSGLNRIQAGNLDVEMYHTSASNTNEKVDGETDLFTDKNGNSILWEPGVVTWEAFTIENVGTLALKYQLAMNIGNYNTVYDAYGNDTGRSLKNVIDVYVLDGKNTYDTRAAAINATAGQTAVTLSDFIKVGNLDPKDGTKKDISYTVILYWNPENNDRDNLYDLKNGAYASDSNPTEVGQLYIDLGIQLNATQYTAENDSFGNDYDEDADGVNDYTGNVTTASSSQTVSTNGSATFTTANSPAKETKNTTTVDFPDGALTSDKTAEVTVKTTDTVAASTANYNITGTNGVVLAAIDLNLTVDGQEVTQFNGKSATITTYIAKCLNQADMKIVYTGNPSEEIIVTSYDPDTGKLVFSTSHFSEYVVTSSTAVAYNPNTEKAYITVQDAVDDAESILLLKDVSLTSTVTVSKNVNINLNDNSLTGNNVRALHITSGNVSLTGNGFVTSQGIEEASSVIRIGDNSGESRSASLTIGEGVEVKSECSYGVTVFGSKTTETLTVDGKVTTTGAPAISGNGSTGYGGTRITVNGSVTTSDENAIYHPQAGSLTINGTVSGKGGMEIKSGEATVAVGDPAVITATGEPSHDANSNGCSTQGYAIAVVNNSAYTGSAIANIKGGTVNGEIAVIDDNNVETDKQGKIAITGGVFTHDPSKYVSDGYKAVNEGGKFVIKGCWSSHGEALTENNGVYEISTAVQLAGFANMVNNNQNNFSGKTVRLMADIDLGEYVWIPVGQTGATQFMGTFDGNEYTIKNLIIKNTDDRSNCSTGLFGWLNNATVKNVNVDGADVVGHHNVGVIAGYMEISGCIIENCHVKNANILCTSVNADANGDKCGGIVGHAGNSGVSVVQCSVTDSTISAGRDAGQVVGAAPTGNVLECSANNVNVSSNGTSTGANIRNEVIGRVL